MEATLNKLQQRYKRARDEMGRWDEIQSRLLSQFGNAASIIERLQVLREVNNYGPLGCVPGMKEALLGKQMESLEMIFLSMKETLNGFYSIVTSLDKIARDSSQLLKRGSATTAHQMHLRIGIRPSLSDCLNGLNTIHDMYCSEYLLKLSVISSLTLSCSTDDITALRQLMVDQPNIPTNEVRPDTTSDHDESGSRNQLLWGLVMETASPPAGDKIGSASQDQQILAYRVSLRLEVSGSMKPIFHDPTLEDGTIRRSVIKELNIRNSRVHERKAWPPEVELITLKLTKKRANSENSYTGLQLNKDVLDVRCLDLYMLIWRFIGVKGYVI